MRKTSRREFLEGTGASLAAAALPVPGTAPAPGVPAGPDASPPSVPRTAVRLVVNGVERRLEVEDRWTLAEVLRDHLGLTGTKVGCDRGECGACTVRLDGRPVYSCSLLAAWADGRTVQTVEGLARHGRLDPLQQAFVEHDGPQCGFCTPGQLLTARALLDGRPHPTPEEVRTALAGNLCRCSNYQRYVEAVLAAAGGVPGAPPPKRRGADGPDASGLAPLTVVGRPTPRIDADERVTGRATYTGDVRLPGMLYARVLRSPHPHARIRRIDVSRARASPGVRAIITRENCRVSWSSGDSRNTRYLFNDPVRFVGDAVAAVAAVDRHAAEEALGLVDVDYEPLDFVLDPEEALQPGAPAIHPGGNLSPDTEGRREPEVYRRGDVEAGFQASDLVLEERYTSCHVNNAQLEPRVSVAVWEGSKLTVYASTQGISNCRDDLAKDLKLPPEDVRVVCAFMGGGFGNKNQCHDFDLMAAVLAREAGSPVKLEFTRKEDFVAVHGRWPTRQYYKVGLARDGTLRALQLRGYSGMGPYRKGSGNIAGTELFQCPNVETAVYPAYTNTAVAANFRAPAYPQGVFGIEAVLDEAAHRLGMDPVDFHLKNLTRRYRDERPYTSNGLEECVRRGAEALGWKARYRPAGADPGAVKRGVGMALGGFGSRLGRSSAVLRLDARGRVSVHVGVTDIGTGAKTTMALLAAEELGLPLEKVEVVSGDTDRCPYSVGESGSRTTGFTGYAVLAAARDLKRQMAEKGPPRGGDLLVASASPEPRLEGMVRTSFAAHFVELEVDTELGQVRVLRYVAVHDSGRILNPLTAVSQVRGGVTMGIGMALHEELLYDRQSGVPLNPGYYGARVMTHRDTPEVEVLFVETDDGHGPYGAKSLGEPPIIPSVAAIANAVFNATGRRIKDLPLTRDKLLGGRA
jgi:putative selenate reductase molybdopterin-binding subunit